MSVLDDWDERVDVVLEASGMGGAPLSPRRFAAAPVQAVRRVETPPGVQAQHGWFDVTGGLDGARVPLHGLIGARSQSRATFVWVSPTMSQLAWQTGHLALFQRLRDPDDRRGEGFTGNEHPIRHVQQRKRRGKSGEQVEQPGTPRQRLS